MKLSINTPQLQALVSKSVKGASCNKMIPMTSMMAIERKDNVFTLITTDANNYMLISVPSEGDDFYVVVPAILFSQLVAKLTSETTTLSFDDGKFTVYANGEYKIELPLDENGDFIKLPTPYTDILGQKPTTKITLDAVKRILKVNKPSLATTLEVPCYTGYYAADRIISTDTYKLCGNKIDVFKTPVLIAPETMLLLDNVEDASIEVTVTDNQILFNTETCKVYGNLMSGIEDYAVDAISQLLDAPFDSSCKVVRNALMEAVDRVGLFVSDYDNHSVKLQFTKEGIEVSSPQASGAELVEYEGNKGDEFECAVNIEMLIAQLQASVEDVVTIEYGQPNTIKIVSDEVVQVIALDA